MSSGDSAQSGAFDAQVLELLACPVCFGRLRLDSLGAQDVRIVCVECLRAYPLIDGIPVLIPERAGLEKNDRSAHPTSAAQ